MLSVNCFAQTQQDYMGTYGLYASWNDQKHSYDKGAGLSANTENLPTLRIAAEGLYMPQTTLVCDKPKYDVTVISPTQVNPQSFAVLGEPVTNILSITVTSEACGMQLMFVNNKFMMVFPHDDPPMVYVKQ